MAKITKFVVRSVKESIAIMKTKLIVGVLFLSICLINKAEEPFSWPSKELDTARDISWLSSSEKEMILEVNKLRYNPRQYATQYLEWMLLYYDGKSLKLPNNRTIVHNEGIESLKTLIQSLKSSPSLPILFPARGMTKAARMLVYDQSLTGKTGYVSSGNRTTSLRLSTFGNWYGTIGEAAYYGETDTRTILINMLFDAWVTEQTPAVQHYEPRIPIDRDCHRAPQDLSANVCH